MKETRLTTYTCAVTPAQGARIRRDLEARGYVLDPLPYAHFRAQRDKLTVVAYESGKLVVQGRDTEEFVRFYLEPEVLKEARLGYEHILDDEFYEERIGVDESGKGDYFGPLVTAGVYVCEQVVESWRGEGIQDSKRIGSDKSIARLAQLIRGTPKAVAEAVLIGNAAYNRLHAKMRTVNDVLAWAHARAIENVLGKAPAPKAISDQFGNPALIRRALMERGRRIELIQRTKAESDMAVAAASIVARAAFVDRLRQMSEKWGVRLPPGASAAVRAAAVEFVKKHGAENLVEVAKLHFRTTEQVLDEAEVPAAARAAARDAWRERMAAPASRA